MAQEQRNAGRRDRERGVIATGRSLIVVAAVLVACSLPVACTTPDPTASRAKSTLGRPPGPVLFSGQTAWQHMRTLNEFGPRVTGSRAAANSREFLRETLSRAGVPNRELRTLATIGDGDVIELHHVLASVPGRSNDVIVLAAHYDLPESDAREPRLRPDDQRASGAALLLELARVALAGDVPDYTLWIVFIDGDAAGPTSSSSPSEHLGTRSLVEDWSRTGELENVRAAIFFGAVGHRDLPMLRDIDSPRVYRELFWEAARDLGHAARFPSASPYGRAQTGRSTFAQIAGRSSVALANADTPLLPEAEGSPSSAAGNAPTPAPRRASSGLHAVGRVTLEALERAAAKLRRIDRFAQAPLRAGREPVEPPAAQP